MLPEEDHASVITPDTALDWIGFAGVGDGGGAGREGRGGIGADVVLGESAGVPIAIFLKGDVKLPGHPPVDLEKLPSIAC
jgi:hypothetical protein